MNCKDFLERLDAYLDAEMSQPERQAFLSHAQNCSSCREELRRAEAIRDALAHMNDGLSVPLAAQAAWRGAVKRGSRRRKNRVLYRAISAVAAAFVLMAGTTAVFRATGVLDFDGDVRRTYRYQRAEGRVLRRGPAILCRRCRRYCHGPPCLVGSGWRPGCGGRRRPARCGRRRANAR